MPKCFERPHFFLDAARRKGISGVPPEGDGRKIEASGGRFRETSGLNRRFPEGKSRDEGGGRRGQVRGRPLERADFGRGADRICVLCLKFSEGTMRGGPGAMASCVPGKAFTGRRKAGKEMPEAFSGMKRQA